MLDNIVGRAAVSCQDGMKKMLIPHLLAYKQSSFLFLELLPLDRIPQLLGLLWGSWQVTGLLTLCTTIRTFNIIQLLLGVPFLIHVAFPRS